jgi:hypothetical protein
VKQGIKKDFVEGISEGITDEKPQYHTGKDDDETPAKFAKVVG